MPTVDFVYDKDCPNVKSARANLMRAFAQANVPARWEEHQIGAVDAPARVRGFGSPSILVDGIDVAGAPAGAEDCCRIYESGRAPSAELIAAALEGPEREDEPPEAKAPASRSGWKSMVAVLPGIGIALMPKVVCPLCWPAYAGVLSAFGLTFLMEDRWLLPISAVFLLLALAALAWRARARRGYGPFALGLASAIIILAGKFAFDSTATVYVGIATLFLSCIWNVWPRRVIEPTCSAC